MKTTAAYWALEEIATNSTTMEHKMLHFRCCWKLNFFAPATTPVRFCTSNLTLQPLMLLLPAKEILCQLPFLKFISEYE